MEESEKELILNALKQNGFDLEWRVAQMLKQALFEVESNLHGPPSYDDDELVSHGPELDILAVKELSGYVYSLFVECKGAPPEI